MKIPVPTPAAAPTVTALPFEAVKPKLGTQTAATQPAPAEEAPPKSRVGFYIGVGVAAALIFAVIAVVLDARMEKAKAYDLEQQEALAHHVAEQRLKEAEQSAKEELERSRKELETAIEITKKQTEAETRRKLLAEIEAERLAKAPGAIVLSTVPSGAQVSIDGAAPVTSPVRQDGIAPGAHHIRVTLDGHDPVELAADVKGSKTTDLGTVTLPTALGELDLTSSPDDLEYAVRRDDDPQGKPLRTGRTPAEIADLPHGNYTVTFMRPGCRDHVEKAEVAKGSKTPVGTRYLDGSLELASDPSGAWVDKEGTRLGTTPLILHDLTPKTANFELTLPGYDPTPVSCEIPEGQTLKLDAKLLRRDRVFTPAEVKTQPTSYESPQPSLSATQRRAGGTVTLSLIVRQDGSVSDVAVVKASDDDIARRCKAALEAWKYHPATAPDDRQVDARIEVSFKFMAQNP
jgi:TonB family protein